MASGFSRSFLRGNPLATYLPPDNRTLFLDLGAEFADSKGIALGPIAASDVTKTVITLGAAAANYLNYETRYSDIAFYASLPLWEKTLYNWTLKALGKPGKFAKSGVKAVAVRAASSGLAQYANPAVAGTFRSIPA